jgi:hypothetical protein
MIAVYFASKARHAPFVQALRAAGVNITATWPDWPMNYCTDEPTADQWRQHVQACIEQAAVADVTLLYAQAEETQFGSLIECGSALAAGRQIYLVSPHAWPFLRNHPRVRSFETLADAIAAITSIGKETR